MTVKDGNPSITGAQESRTSSNSRLSGSQTVENWTDENGLGHTVVTRHQDAKNARRRSHFAWSRLFDTLGVAPLANARGPQTTRLSPFPRSARELAAWAPSFVDIASGIQQRKLDAIDGLAAQQAAQGLLITTTISGGGLLPGIGRMGANAFGRYWYSLPMTKRLVIVNAIRRGMSELTDLEVSGGTGIPRLKYRPDNKPPVITQPK